MLSTRLLSYIASGALATVLTVLSYQSPVSAQEKLIRIGYQPGPNLPWVIKEKQLLEKRGYKTDWVLFPYAAPELEALTAGAIDIASAGTLPIVMMGVANKDIWYIFDEAGNVAGMVVDKKSNIRKAADLKGKRIAFPGKGSQQYGLLMSYLKGSGISDSDMDLYRANAPDMRVLLEKNQVSGFVAWAPFTSEAVRNGYARDLWIADDLHKLKNGHWIGAGASVRAAFAKSSGQAVVDYVRAAHEAAELLRNRPGEVIPIFSKASGLPPEGIEFLLKNKYYVYFDKKDTVPSAAALKQMLEILAEHKVVRVEGDLDSIMANFVHPEFAEKALK